MKIAILSSASAGGAGIAAYRLYEAFEKTAEHEVDFFDIEAFDETVCQTISPQHSATNGQITNTHFTIDHANDKRDWVIELLLAYDVINIHWASYLISLSEIYELAKRGKKILFTLHDFYSITGGCHYPAGCLGYLNNCLACPQINEKLHSQQVVIANNKLKRALFLYPNVHLSAPSEFIVTSALKSGIIPKERAHVLRNTYQPICEFVAQPNRDNKTILLIADSFNEQRKGLALAINSLKRVAESFNKTTKTKITLHLVGGLSVEVVKRLDGSGITVKKYGHVKEHQKLVTIFKQCQFILTCSYEDNWPNILVEAGSYGCIPIVGKWQGCEEFVHRLGLGFIANAYTPIEFAHTITLAMNNNLSPARIEKYTHEVRNIHSAHEVVSAYIAVFKDSQKHNVIQNSVQTTDDMDLSVNHLRLLLAQFYQDNTTISIRFLNTPFGEQKRQTQTFKFHSFKDVLHFVRSRRTHLIKENMDTYGLQQLTLSVDSKA